MYRKEQEQKPLLFLLTLQMVLLGGGILLSVYSIIIKSPFGQPDRAAKLVGRQLRKPHVVELPNSIPFEELYKAIYIYIYVCIYVYIYIYIYTYTYIYMRPF